MTTTQKLLANLKKDIDTLNRMGDESSCVYQHRYDAYTNDNRPNYFSIIKDRCSVLTNIVLNLNSNEEFRKEEAYEYLVESFTSLVEDYETFVLSADLRLDANRLLLVRHFYKARKCIVDLGNDMINALTGCADEKYSTKVTELLFSF